MRKRILSVIMALAIAPLSGYAMETIQTQPSSDGNFEASLTSIKIKRGVLTINIRVKNVSLKSAGMDFSYKEVYYIDVDNKKKYFVLRDSEGKYIAGPNLTSGTFYYSIDPDGQKIAWIKFPAPPETTNTIDIFVPGILPFEEIKVTR